MLKTVLAIILFGLAFKASGAFSAKRPGELPVLPDDATANDDEQLEEAKRSAADFLLGAEAYIDARPMARMQHKAMVAQLEILAGKQVDKAVELPAPVEEGDSDKA